MVHPFISLWFQGLVCRDLSSFSPSLILGRATCGARRVLSSEALWVGNSSFSRCTLIQWRLQRIFTLLFFVTVLLLVLLLPTASEMVLATETPMKALVKSFPVHAYQHLARTDRYVCMLIVVNAFYLLCLSVFALDFKTRCYVKILVFAVVMRHI